MIIDHANGILTICVDLDYCIHWAVSSAIKIATNSDLVDEGHSDKFAWADRSGSLLTQNVAPIFVYTKLGFCLPIVVGVLGVSDPSV
ncbi:hypothetical protein RIR_jg35889.t1 [Rhizophagus irregularis DAOM 181602=DAOM 197198]|nr:hypothetical protein RIR_jg35889.t1 [Rhizophagus irregularis DAOM 181602=DAOM 197198]